MAQETTLKVIAQMPASTFKRSQDAPLTILKAKSGKLFFQCGSIIGHVSPAVQENISSLTLDDLNYGLFEKEDGGQFHCITRKSTEAIVKEF